MTEADKEQMVGADAFPLVRRATALSSSSICSWTMKKG